ncbi:MAG: glycosyltransferase [Candidatus Omnitrophica bacterium]|nr:glycosyltransferase [Candidatus Omnitrophota bacterium]
MSKKIILMYISDISGHHSASRAMEQAIKAVDTDAEVLNINAFSYTNPIWERVVNRAYMSVVKSTPEIWDYLYDNPKVLRRTQGIRERIHRAQTEKLKKLFHHFKPDVVACTQAYPCGMVADYKKTFNLNLPLVGILTDYAPHSYWIYDNIEAYIVPSHKVGQKLIKDGVRESRVKPLGIPIDPRFSVVLDSKSINEELNLEHNLPKILIMGGGQGLGAITKFLLALDKIKQDFQILVVAGANKKLYNWIKKRKFKRKVVPFGYIDFVEKLMEVATLIVTKPGGVTTAEALSKKLPMIIVDPLPGQEMMNAKFLLEEGIALKADSEKELARLVKELLDNPDKLEQMSRRIQAHAKPDSAIKIAELILGLPEAELPDTESDLVVKRN